MSKGFNLGEYLKGSGTPSVTAAGVSELNTGREELRYLPLDQIDPDPANFYSLEGLDELAGNIELVGLQQPLRLRPNGERFVVVSGHRRRAACLLIRDGGNPMFDKGVPCLVDYGEASDAMRELRLIFANSSTRVMSSAEQSKQAERVTELLYQLKEQGVEFPGRMRDHVAEACRMSSAKLARLHAIRERLVPELLAEFDAGRINESVAYRISQEEAEIQAALAKAPAIVRGETAEKIGQILDKLKAPATPVGADPQISPKNDGPMRASAPTEDDEGDGEDEGPDAISGLKKYLDGKSKEDRVFWESLELVADEFIKRTFRAPMTGPAARKNSIDELRFDLHNAGAGRSSYDWDGSNKGLRIGPDVGHRVERTWTEVYDALAAIAITRYRQTLVDRGRKTDCHTSAAALVRNDPDPPRWQTGTPGRAGRYLCRLDLGLNKLTEQRCDFRDGAWTAYGRPVSDVGKVVDWWPLPDDYVVLGREDADGDEDEDI